MTKGHGQILNFLGNASPPKALDVVTSNCRCIGNMNISCDLDLKVKGQIMYFLVNASSP